MKRGPYKTKPIPGSFADLIARFRQSPRYRGWSRSTATVNDRTLDRFRAKNGREQVSDLRRGDVIAMRDQLGDTPSAANNWLKVIRVLLDYAVDLEMVPINVSRTVKRLKVPNPDGYRTWREDEIESFLHHYAADTIPHRALVLMLCTGAARADVVRMGWHSVHGERIHYHRQKTCALVNVPVLPQLADVLRAVPAGQSTFLETRDGLPRSEKSLTSSMREWTEKAGLGAPNEAGHYLGCHGLRKAAGRRLAEAGCSPHEIMSWLGHEDLKSAAIYTKAYDRARSADSAAEKMGNISPPESRVIRLKKPSPPKG